MRVMLVIHRLVNWAHSPNELVSDVPEAKQHTTRASNTFPNRMKQKHQAASKNKTKQKIITTNAKSTEQNPLT